MELSCDQRVTPHFDHLHHALQSIYGRPIGENRNELELAVRYLDKIFQIGINDAYTITDRIKVVQRLTEMGACNRDVQVSALLYLYAAMINRHGNLGIPDGKIPVYAADPCLDVDMVREDRPPVKDRRVDDLILRYANSEEAMQLYGIRISKGHFVKNDIKDWRNLV